MTGLAIRDVAERTGLAPATIRVWEQRHGFPQPRRTPSGYRLYSPDDVEVLRQVVLLRQQGLSVPAALERARAAAATAERPSIYAAVTADGLPAPPFVLRKATLTAMSRAIEDEALARAVAPLVVGAFQTERNYRAVERRYRRLARCAEAVLVFADFPAPRLSRRAPAELPLAPDDEVGSEWAVVVDAPGYAACLIGWERPGSEIGTRPDAERRFEALLTLDPALVRRALTAAATLAARCAPALAHEVRARLAERPLALETPVPGLNALANRMVAYVERDLSRRPRR